MAVKCLIESLRDLGGQCGIENGATRYVLSCAESLLFAKNGKT